MTLSTYWSIRRAKICGHYQWYNIVAMWNDQGYVSDEEIRDGVRYLEKLKK